MTLHSRPSTRFRCRLGDLPPFHVTTSRTPSQVPVARLAPRSAEGPLGAMKLSKATSECCRSSFPTRSLTRSLETSWGFRESFPAAAMQTRSIRRSDHRQIRRQLLEKYGGVENHLRSEMASHAIRHARGGCSLWPHERRCRRNAFTRCPWYSRSWTIGRRRM